MVDSRLPVQVDVVSDAAAEGAYTSFPAGSTYPPLTVELSDADGDVLDLTDAVSATLSLAVRGEPAVEAQMDFADRESGRVRYRWRAGDVADPATLKGRITVRFSDGQVLEAPTESQLIVHTTD